MKKALLIKKKNINWPRKFGQKFDLKNEKYAFVKNKNDGWAMANIAVEFCTSSGWSERYSRTIYEVVWYDETGWYMVVDGWAIIIWWWMGGLCRQRTKPLSHWLRCVTTPYKKLVLNKQMLEPRGTIKRIQHNLTFPYKCTYFCKFCSCVLPTLYLYLN